MKTKSFYNLFFIVACITNMLACSNSNKQATYINNDEASASKEAEHYTSIDHKPLPQAVDSAMKSKQWMRKAELKFKVEDVSKATDYIEFISSKYTGFITLSDLKTSIYWTNSIPTEEDSLEETKHYHVDNQVIIQVPNLYMDSLLKDLKPLMLFLDYRKITAEDARITLLANAMQTQRINTFEKRYTTDIDSKGKKLNDVLSGEETLLKKQLQLDEQKIESLKTQDKIVFSTVVLHIYQPSIAVKSIIANEFRDNKPSFFTRLYKALKGSWEVLEEIILFLVRIWVFILLGIGVYIYYKRILKKKV